MKNTFYAYLDYFNLDKRVIYHLSKEDPFFSTKSECQIVYYNLDKSKILSVLDGGEVNFSKSNKKQDPCPIYIVENELEDNFIEVAFEYCSEDKKVTILGFSINKEEGICEF